MNEGQRAVLSERSQAARWRQQLQGKCGKLALLKSKTETLGQGAVSASFRSGLGNVRVVELLSDSKRQDMQTATILKSAEREREY